MRRTLLNAASELGYDKHGKLGILARHVLGYVELSLRMHHHRIDDVNVNSGREQEIGRYTRSLMLLLLTRGR